MIFVLLISCLLTLLTVGIHYFFLTNLSRFLIEREFHTRHWVGFSILILILAHVLEVTVYSIGYALLDGHPDFGQLVPPIQDANSDYWYFSSVVYTSLGFGDITPTDNLRLMTAIETLTGLIMIAWTASFIYVQMQRCWTGEPKPNLEDLPGLK